MNKTFNINISGFVFTVDDNAYELLKNYLDTLHNVFASSPDCAELTSDIEQRIAEILMESTAGGSRVVGLAEVEAIISRMGRPEEFFDGEAVIEEPNGSGRVNIDSQTYNMVPPPYIPKGRRRLFRDPFNRMIGGVCAGLANYLGVDATWVRLIAVVLAFASLSTICVAYIIMWIVVPEAHTPLEVMQMKGESPTMENIGRTVTDSFRQVRDQINVSIGQFQTTDTPVKRGKAFADGLAQVFGFIGRVILVIGIFVCCTLVLAFGLGLFGCLIALIIFLTPYGFDISPELAEKSRMVIPGILCSIGYILAIGIPLFMLLWFMLRSYSRQRRPMPRGWKVSLVAAWVIGFLMAGVCTGIIVALDENDSHVERYENQRRVIHRDTVVDIYDSGERPLPSQADTISHRDTIAG